MVQLISNTTDVLVKRHKLFHLLSSVVVHYRAELMQVSTNFIGLQTLRLGQGFRLVNRLVLYLIKMVHGFLQIFSLVASRIGVTVVAVRISTSRGDTWRPYSRGPGREEWSTWYAVVSSGRSRWHISRTWVHIRAKRPSETRYTRTYAAHVRA